jgi:hypothetical protein
LQLSWGRAFEQEVQMLSITSLLTGAACFLLTACDASICAATPTDVLFPFLMLPGAASFYVKGWAGC